MIKPLHVAASPLTGTIYAGTSKMEQAPRDGETIAVWFSCGAASAIAAAETLRLYGDICTVRILNNPVAEEDADNQRFLKDVEKWLGVKIESVINESFPDASAVSVWDKKSYMAGNAGAPCTVELKKRARQKWEKDNHVDWHVLGFTSEEKHRHNNFKKTERENLLGVLVDQEITKGECFNRLFEAGVKIPAIYARGYPNANCIGCVKASSPTYWNHVRKQDPEVFAARAEQSRRIGARLVRVKGKRIFLDELDEEAKGRPIKDMDFECGIFCEEKL